MTIDGAQISVANLIVLLIASTTWTAFCVMAAAITTRRYRRRRADEFAMAITLQLTATLEQLQRQLQRAQADEAARIIGQLLPLLAQRTAEIRDAERHDGGVAPPGEA